jgi:hypothetical protein
VPGAARIEVLPAFDADAVHAAVKQLPDLAGLPGSLLELKEFVEKRIGVPVIGMGLGPERDCMAEFARPSGLRASGR